MIVLTNGSIPVKKGDPMANKLPKTIDYSTGELNEEINLRAQHLAKSLLEVNTPPFRKPMSRISVSVDFSHEESMTHQAHAESCDVNNVIGRYARTGQLPPSTRQAQFADVTHLNKDLTTLYEDMQELSGRIRLAQKAVKDKQAADLAKEAEELKAFREEKAKPPATPPAE